MSEKLSAKQYAEQLLYKPEYAADKQPDVKEKAAAFAEGYKNFLDHAKTEREAAATSEQMLLAAGYKAFEPKKAYAPGEKVYFIQENKAVVAATIGQKPYEEGFRLVIAHIDCPRLDLRPNPLYESDHMSYFRTHYYGGIRKYQWATIPLAIHGVFTRADGSSVSFAVGEDENDPVFCITDLLPHLGAEQNDRKLSEGIKAEELNVLIGSDAVEDADIKEAVKLNTLMLLHEKYGVTERDFTRAEIEVVPAHKARDIGFDRSMVGGYGHDDRVDAYPALMAEIETKNPVHTTVCVLTDKEEIGSDGVTGMQSMYVFHFMQMLCQRRQRRAAGPLTHRHRPRRMPERGAGAGRHAEGVRPQGPYHPRGLRACHRQPRRPRRAGHVLCGEGAVVFGHLLNTFRSFPTDFVRPAHRHSVGDKPIIAVDF